MREGGEQPTLGDDLESRMRPRLLTILLLLLAGAVVNVAVAWGSAASVDLWSDIWLQRHGTSSSTFPCWGVVVIRKPSATYVFRSAISRPHTRAVGWLDNLDVPYWSQAAERPANEPLDSYRGYTEDGRGWPLICLVSSMDATLNNPGRGWTYGAVSGGISLAGFQGSDQMPRSLPLRPVWTGLALNTLTSAALLWLLFFAPFTLRRHLRARRDLCPACGYPVGESAACSECGRAVGETTT